MAFRRGRHALAGPDLPHTDRAHEIGEMGGSAFLLSSDVITGEADLVRLFNAARDDEYDEIVDRCEDFLRQVRKESDEDHFTYAELDENDVDLVKLRSWFDKVKGRDVLGATGMEAAVEALARCEQSLEDYAARVYAREGDGD